MEYGIDFYRKKFSREGGGYKELNYVHRTRISHILQFIERGNILDVGVGNGVIITSLPKENNLVVGIDITASTLKKFKNKGYMCLGDVHHLPFKNESFSSVLMGEVLEHLKYPFLALKEVHRTLDKDGCLVISLPNKYGVWSLYVDTLITALKGWNPEGHVNKFSLKDVRKILHDAGFKDYKVINTAIVGSFLRLQALMKLDVYLSKLFPKYFASGWVIKAVKRETS